MVHSKNIIFFFLYTFLLTFLFFLAQSIFFGQIQEEYDLEPVGKHSGESFDLQSGYYSFSGTSTQEVEKKLVQLIRNKYLESSTGVPKEDDDQTNEIHLHYLPSSIQEKAELSYTPLLKSFLQFPDIFNSIETLGVYMYENIEEVRGRMKLEKIHMFGVGSIEPEEFLGVFIHEFGHYFDIYTLSKSAFGDESQKFYDISWESQSTMKKQALQSDFVSGYAMTNQYEDFAESYVYYILHNKDFFSRAQGSKLLRQKYEFFEIYVFSKRQFYKENFSGGQELQNYYWDITKIPTDVEKFLQYLQKEI